MKHFKKIFLALVILLGVGLASCKKDTTLADAKKELEITYTEGQDITLPAKVGDVVITWSSDKPAVISNAGKVVQGTEDVVVKITATLTYKGKTDTKEFTITVKKGIVAGAAKAALIEHYKDTLGSATFEVKEDIELIASIAGATIIWTSDNPEFFSNDGKVTIPTYRQGDQSISLKASLSDGDFHTFRFNLVAKEATVRELIEEQLDLVAVKPAGDYQEIDFVVMNEVTIKGETVAVTWVTSDEEAMTADGKLVVFYEPAEKNVTLTATITYQGETVSRDINFKVKSALRYETFKEALVPANKDEKVMITNVSYFESLATDGFYMIDNTGKLGYFYGGKPADVVAGKVYNVLATVDAYYHTAQLTSFSFTEAEGTVNEVQPEEVTFESIVSKPAPTATNWNQHSIILLKDVRVRIDGEDNYNTHIVSKDLPLDASLTGQNSFIIYYKSNIEPVRALNGKVIDEIVLINNGFRTDQAKWNFNFLGVADDIKITLTPEEIMEIAKAEAKAFVKNAYYAAQTLTFPTEVNEATLEWASNNALIDAATGAVTMPEGAAVEVTLTATITVGELTGSIEIKTMVGPLVLMSIADFKAQGAGYVGMIKGVVTSMNGNKQYVIEDENSGITLFSDDALEYGKEVTIVGVVEIRNGLVQIAKASDVALVIADGTMPALVTVPETVALTAEGLLPYQSRRLSIEGFTIIDKKVDKYGTTTLTLKRGTETVDVRWDNRVSLSAEAKAHLEGLAVEQKVNLVGAPLGWHNGPQFGYDHESQIYVVPATDPTAQANEVLAGLDVPAEITTATDLVLPTTGNYEAVIAWVSSHPEIIATDGKVTLPAENTTVTLTATVTVGEAVVSKTFDVRVKVVEGMEILDIYALEQGNPIDVTGVIIAINEKNTYIYDGSAAIVFYRAAAFTDVIGDEIQVVGTLDIWNGLYQIKNAVVTPVTKDNEVPKPILLTELREFNKIDQSLRFSINDVVVKSIDKRNMVVTDGTKEITVYSPKEGAVYDHFATAKVGQHINIKGMPLGWYNAAQFMLTSVAELELLEFTDAQKVAADIAAIVLPEETIVDVTLPATGNNGSAITWVSSHPAIIGNDGKIVALPEENTEVTFTGTFKLGTVEETHAYKVIINKSGTVIEEPIYQTGFESSDGFTASTKPSYNNTEVKFSGPAGKQWGTYYGTPSTTSPIGDAQSMQMRWYAASSSDHGYTYTNFDLANINKVVFTAKNTNGINVIVSISKDGGTTWENAETFVLSTTATEYTYNVAEEFRSENMRIKFTLTYETAPSETSRLYIDDVKVF